MAQMATTHISNISVLSTSRYAVSSGTFPSYFLKQLSVVAKNQMYIDVSLFAKYIAPFFNTSCRFVGQEPLCKTTAAYNEVMAEVLKLYSIKLIEIPRIIANDMLISATLVRKAFANNDITTLRSLVPPTTLDILQSLSVNTCQTVFN
jgi:[citrate (pro-3S)-lyase] ligase